MHTLPWDWLKPQKITVWAPPSFIFSTCAVKSVSSLVMASLVTRSRLYFSFKTFSIWSAAEVPPSVLMWIRPIFSKPLSSTRYCTRVSAWIKSVPVSMHRYSNPWDTDAGPDTIPNRGT